MIEKYVLICCCGREIEEPQFFDTHEEAYEAMKEDYEESRRDDSEEAIGENYAYCETHNHDYADWKFYKLAVSVNSYNKKVDIKPTFGIKEV